MFGKSTQNKGIQKTRNGAAPSSFGMFAIIVFLGPVVGMLIFFIGLLIGAAVISMFGLERISESEMLWDTIIAVTISGLPFGFFLALYSTVGYIISLRVFGYVGIKAAIFSVLVSTIVPIAFTIAASREFVMPAVILSAIGCLSAIILRLMFDHFATKYEAFHAK